MEAKLGIRRIRGAIAGVQIKRRSIFATSFLNSDSLARTSVRSHAPPIATRTENHAAQKESPDLGR